MVRLLLRFGGLAPPTFCQFAWRTRPDRAGLPHSVPHMSGSIRRHRSSPGSWLAVEGNRSEALSCEPKSRAPRGSGARAPSASGVCPIVELAKTFAVPRQTVVAAVAPDHPVQDVVAGLRAIWCLLALQQSCTALTARVKRPLPVIWRTTFLRPRGSVPHRSPDRRSTDK